eukprot:s1828_g20.t1
MYRPLQRPITPRWIYVLTILLWCTDAIATGTLFDVYINDLARRQGYPHPNEFIGIMESSRGITCLVVAVPLGFLFDRFDRLRVLRCAMICFGLTGILSEHLPLAVPGLALYAIFFQAATASLDALLADTLPPPKRTGAYALARTLQTSSRALGPGLQAVVLLIFPSKKELGKLLVGGFSGLVAFLLILWPLQSGHPSDLCTATSAPLASSHSGHSEHAHERVLGIPKHVLVPGLAMVFNLFIMMGGGIALKFFPLFYHQEYGLSDMAVCWIMAGYWVSTALGSYTAAFLSRIARRPVLVIGTQLIGASLMFLFVLTQPLFWNLTIFEFRPIVQNAHMALNTALTMEYALPQHRGKWASVGSLNRATFAGSAVVGGVLTDEYSFRVAFAVTGCILVCALVIYSPMLLIVRHA